MKVAWEQANKRALLNSNQVIMEKEAAGLGV